MGETALQEPKPQQHWAWWLVRVLLRHCGMDYYYGGCNCSAPPTRTPAASLPRSQEVGG